jgi:hypothetical protein
MIALVSCFGIFYWSNIRRKKVAEQAQQVVLAAFIRDESGKVLVTPEGLLPSQKITRKFNQRVSSPLDLVMSRARSSKPCHSPLAMI